MPLSLPTTSCPITGCRGRAMPELKMSVANSNLIMMYNTASSPGKRK